MCLYSHDSHVIPRMGSTTTVNYKCQLQLSVIVNSVSFTTLKKYIYNYSTSEINYNAT